MSTTIRVSERSRDRLAALSRATGRPMTEVVEEAVDALERRLFFIELNAGFAALRADDDQWSAVLSERATEERTVGDSSR